jgi:electron transfer flavoprotein-quinone oxidoreductase
MGRGYQFPWGASRTDAQSTGGSTTARNAPTSSAALPKRRAGSGSSARAKNASPPGGRAPSDHLEAVKQHPLIKKLIEGGKTVEYSAHLIPEGGYKSMPPLVSDGFLVAGDAAQMTNPAYREGSNLAMTAGKLAGEAVIEAKKKGDFSKAGLASYKAKLEASYVLSDMEDIKDLEEHVENSEGFLDFYPKLACELAHLRFSADGVPKRDHLKTAIGMVAKRGFLRVAKDLFPLRKVAI